MTTALLAEDEALLAETLQRELQRAWPQLQHLPVAPHGAAAVAACLEHRPDIVFLDIRMPGMDGLEAAARIVEACDPPPLIVFVTAYDAHAVAAFETQAFDYLLKPVQPERLAQTVRRLQSRLQERDRTPAALPAKTDLDPLRALLEQLQAPALAPPRLRHLQAAVGDAVELVPVADLLYLEAADKYVRAVTAQRDYWVRTALRELLPQLDPAQFWQIHRGTVVNIDAVQRAQRLENGQLHLQLRERPETLTVSRLHAGRFKAF